MTHPVAFAFSRKTMRLLAAQLEVHRLEVPDEIHWKGIPIVIIDYLFDTECLVVDTQHQLQALLKAEQTYDQNMPVSFINWANIVANELAQAVVGDPVLEVNRLID